MVRSRSRSTARRGSTRVRDHRRERHRVRARRGRTAQARIDGTITLDDDVEISPDQLMVTRSSDGSRSSDHDLVELEWRDERTATFDVSVARGDGTAPATLRLGDSDGHILATRRFTGTDRGDEAAVAWLVYDEREVFESTTPDAPLLHGYVVTVLPTCPNPDEALDWDG
ncbi:MAG TPA: hypothetical protein VK860_00780, partial [Ilumatobacteraceae bacterium]|nr:hypothetical protein [Ilumatobacteraceae bacterium]